MKSERNKTIDFPIEQAEKYVAQCEKETQIKEVTPNSVVIGDVYESLKKVKDNSVDLLIVDPPYNLDKSFHGNNFKKSNDK
ncbi:MAG: site-specific DNA-methyltransferase, partial [Clostridia bacterium]|nr:site-specific DNA-methyltransferase [Clostridia bacterium]